METVLFKSGDKYMLLYKHPDGGSCYHNEALDGELCIKNCQAIERGYDLDEIKRKVFDGFDGIPSSFAIYAVEKTINVMLEIFGDRRFTEDDMATMMLKSAEWVNDGCEIDAEQLLNNTIQSLQQNEWPVEIIKDDTCRYGTCTEADYSICEKGCVNKVIKLRRKQYGK